MSQMRFVLALLIAAVSGSACAQPRRLYAPAGGAGKAATPSIGVAEHADIHRVSRARWQALYGLDLAFRMTRNGVSTAVHLSPDYAYAQEDAEVFVLSEGGSFTVLTKEPMSGDRILTSVSDSELAATPRAMMDYYLRSGYVESGIFPLGGPLSDYWEADSLLVNKSVRIVSRSPTAGGLIKFVYEATLVWPWGGPPTVDPGHFVVDPQSQYVVTEYARRLTLPDGGVRRVVYRFDYHPPSQAIPYHTVKKAHRVQTLNGGKPAEVTTTYDDYRIERLPSERLELSYYNLPDEIVRTRTDYRPYYIVGAVTALVAAGLYLLRRRKREE